LDFQSLFLTQEEDDEDAASLAEALVVMDKIGPTFKATDVVELVNEASPNGVTLRDFLFPGAPSGYIATPKAVGKRLKSHIDEPVRNGDRVLTLKGRAVRGGLSYYVNTGVGPPRDRLTVADIVSSLRS